METKKAKNIYLMAIEIVLSEIKTKRTLKPLTLLFGKKYFKTCGYMFHGTLVDYIRFCRIHHFAICIVGNES